MVFCNLERLMPHLLVYKSKNFGSWVYQLMIQFIVVSSFFLQDYISFIFSLVFFFVVFSFGVVVFLLFQSREISRNLLLTTHGSYGMLGRKGKFLNR